MEFAIHPISKDHNSSWFISLLLSLADPSQLVEELCEDLEGASWRYNLLRFYFQCGTHWPLQNWFDLAESLSMGNFKWLVVVTCVLLRIFFHWPPDCQQRAHGEGHLAIPLRIDIVEIFARFLTIPIICSIKNDFQIPQNVSEMRINRMVPLISIP